MSGEIEEPQESCGGTRNEPCRQCRARLRQYRLSPLEQTMAMILLKLRGPTAAFRFARQMAKWHVQEEGV